MGVATAADGSVFVIGANRIRHYLPDGTVVGEFGQDGDGPGAFKNLAGIAVGGNLLYTVDSELDRVQVFTYDGVFQRQWGSPTPPSSKPRGTDDPPDGTLDRPAAIAVSPSGDVFVRDLLRVQEFTPDGVFVRRHFHYGWDILAFGSDGRAVVSVPQSGAVVLLGTDFARLNRFGSPAPSPSPQGQFDERYGPQGVAVMSDGSIWASDAGNHRIQQFSSHGRFMSACGTPGTGSRLQLPVWLASGPGDRLFVVDNYRTVVEFGPVATLADACDDTPPTASIRATGSTVSIRASERASVHLTITRAPCRMGKRRFVDARSTSHHSINLRRAFPKLHRGTYRISISLRDLKGNVSKSHMLRMHVRSGRAC